MKARESLEGSAEIVEHSSAWHSVSGNIPESITDSTPITLTGFVGKEDVKLR